MMINDMTNKDKEAIELLKDTRMEINYKVNGTTQFSEALGRAIKAFEKLEKIQEIVNIDNSVIQEDVMKYKIICEVIADDR